MSGFGFHCGMVPYTPPPPVCRENVVFITKAWSSGIGRARRCVHLDALHRVGFPGRPTLRRLGQGKSTQVAQTH